MVVEELLHQDQERAMTETRARTKQKRRRPKQARAEQKGARDKQEGKPRPRARVQRISQLSGVTKRVEAQTLLTMNEKTTHTQHKDNK